MCVPLPPQIAQSHMLAFFRLLGNKYGQNCGQKGAVLRHLGIAPRFIALFLLAFLKGCHHVKVVL
jgi:hypothetical protein